MATFSSVTSGNWNDGATWGKTSPGVKGTDWPGNAGDVVNIGTTANQSHAVTYNVSETNALGQITIGAATGTGASRLDFSTGMNTKLTLGYQDILVQLTGELRIGTSGAVLDKAYTAEIVWTPSADSTKGFNIAAGGKLSLYGDPAYYGNDFDTSLSSAWNGSDTTIYLTGDFSGKWLSGQELLIHKGGAYGTTGYINDFALVSVNGTITYDGTKSTAPIAIVHVPSAGSGFAAGGDVLNVSRNIMLYPAGYSHNIGVFPANRLRLANANLVESNNINMKDVQTSGWNVFLTGYGINTDNMICRNCGGLVAAQRGGSHTNIIIYSCNGTNGPINSCHNLIISGYLCGGQWGAFSQSNKCNTPTGQTLKCFGSYRGISGNADDFAAYIYSNFIGISSGSAAGSENTTLRNGAIGYNQAGNSCPNATDLDFLYCCDIKLINTALQAQPPTVVNRNNPTFPGRFNFEHYNRVVNSHYILDAFGDIYKVAADGSGDNPTQRSGGNADVIDVVPQSLCAAALYLEIFNTRLWATAGVSKTYRFYVQTDFVTLPTAELKLNGEFLDEVSGGHLATVSSAQDIATRSGASDWSQFVEVTMNPTQDGYINLYLWLMGYEAGKKVWVDPKPEGVAMTPRWSYGEVVLEPITTSGGGSISPTNLGLVPLGIKQVAI